jgi:hypothetical protein
MKLPTRFEKACAVIARHETERQGQQLTPADIATLFIDFSILAHLAHFPELIDEVGEAHEWPASYIDKLKAESDLARGAELSKL